MVIYKIKYTQVKTKPTGHDRKHYYSSKQVILGLRVIQEMPLYFLHFFSDNEISVYILSCFQNEEFQ